MIDLIWKNRQNDVIVFSFNYFRVLLPLKKVSSMDPFSLHYWFPQCIARLPHPPSCALVAEQIFRWYQKVLRSGRSKTSLFNFSLCRGKTRSTCIRVRFLWSCSCERFEKSEIERFFTRLRWKSKKSIFSDDKTRRHSQNLTAPGARRRKSSCFMTSNFPQFRTSAREKRCEKFACRCDCMGARQ